MTILFYCYQSLAYSFPTKRNGFHSVKKMASGFIGLAMCQKRICLSGLFCLFALQPDQWKFEIVAVLRLYKMTGLKAEF